MKKGVLLPDGSIACPVCGSNQYRLKRSVPAKVGLGIAIGWGAVVAPKRMKCLSCGELYRARAEPQKTIRVPLSLPPPAADSEPASPGPPRTLVLRRSAAWAPMVDALVTVRPDLTREQARRMLKWSRNGPLPLLVDRPQLVVEMARDVLRRAGVYTEIV